VRHLLIVTVLLACQAITLAAPLPVVCSLDAPIAEPRQDVSANVLTDVKQGTALGYQWKSSSGSLRPASDGTAEWNPNGAPQGSYTLSVTVTAPDGSTGSCSLVVVVVAATRGGGGETARRIRSALLLPGKKEEENFGLYSYLLLGSRPNDSNRDRYLAFLKAFTDTVVAWDKLHEQLSPPQINITYIPVRDDLAPATAAAADFKIADWLLDHYDYTRAKKLLESIPGATTDGPYIISSNHPVPESGPRPERYLSEDLTGVPVPIVKFWVNQFRIQTAQERWDRATLSGVALRMRTGLEIASIAYPEIRGAIATLIKGN
jgi:hypothetical protein